MLWSILSVSNEIFVIQGFTTSFWCLLTKRQRPWGRFCSWKILSWKLATHKLMRFSQKRRCCSASMNPLNLRTLSKLKHKLLWNSVEKETDSSSSHPESQALEAAENTSALTINPVCCHGLKHQPPQCLAINENQCPSKTDFNDGSKITQRLQHSKFTVDKKRLQSCPVPGPGVSQHWGRLWDRNLWDQGARSNGPCCTPSVTVGWTQSVAKPLQWKKKKKRHHLPPAAFLASANRGGRRKGWEDCPKWGNTHWSTNWQQFGETIHAISCPYFFFQQQTQGVLVWEGDCGSRREIKRRWRKSRTTLQLHF